MYSLVVISRQQNSFRRDTVTQKNAKNVVVRKFIRNLITQVRINMIIKGMKIVLMRGVVIDKFKG